MVVNDLLVEHFPRVFDIGFTSQMEEELDEIASGERAWVPTMREFYGPFTETLAQAEQTMERVRLKDEPAGEDCEKCGRPMVIKLGQVRQVPGLQRIPGVPQLAAAADDDRRDVPDLPRGRGRRAAVEEGPHVLRLRALSGVRFRLLEQAGRSGLPALRQCVHGRGGRRGQDKCPICGTVVEREIAELAARLGRGLREIDVSTPIRASRLIAVSSRVAPVALLDVTDC